LLAIELLRRGRSDSRPLPPQKCAVTGITTTSYLSISKYWKDPPYDFLRYQSDFVDLEITEILKEGNLRWSSWIIDPSGFRPVKRGEIRGLLRNINNIPTPYGIYCAPDMRRQGGLITEANISNGDPIIFLGETPCYARKTMEIYEQIEPMYLKGIGRNDIETLNVHPAAFKKITQAEWYQFKQKMYPIYKQNEYKLACWLLPTKEEMEGK